MKKMNVMVSLLLAVVLMLGLCACQNKQAPAPEITPVPEATPVPDAMVYTARVDNSVYRSSPEATPDNALGFMNKGVQVRYLDEEGDYIKVSTPVGVDAWVFGWYLECQDPLVERQRQTKYMKSLIERDKFVDIPGDPIYTCMAGLLNCRVLPTVDSAVLCQLEFGDEVRVVGREGNFYLCALPDGSAVYCSVDYMEEQAKYAEVEGAKDLSVFMHEADFDLRFTTEKNITGEAQYPAVPLLEDSTAQMLKKAFDAFREDGYTIKIYDAYRPLSAQQALYEAVGNDKVVADPTNQPSLQQRGRAVDISLVNMYTGRELRMPTAIFDFREGALRVNKDSWNWDTRQNAEYMARIMTEAGFKATGCWWHFENPGHYGLNPEIDYEALTYVPVSQYLAAEKEAEALAAEQAAHAAVVSPAPSAQPSATPESEGN